MKILHYTLGLPPYRTGGLTKYSYDLMRQQDKMGNEVYLLFPGRMKINNKVKIKYYDALNNMQIYELINPLPVPLLNGICNPELYMKTCESDIFKEFLNKKKIEVIHIHTFMGLYKEFLEAARELNIKILYTTHDYYGICTKVNFVDDKGCVCEERNLEKCVYCNQSAYNLKEIFLLQSRAYRFLKSRGIIYMCKRLIYKFKKNKENNDYKKKISNKYREAYITLINYYNDMFNFIDSFLFNSNISKMIYSKYLKCNNGVVIPLVHSNIKDNRKIKKYDHEKLKLTYLGPDKNYKGYNLLIDAINKLDTKYKNKLELNLYGKMKRENISLIIKKNGPYKYEQLKEIFDNTDLLVVPSIWYETFGFIVLEGLSFGVPILISSKVGSKDLLNNTNGIIIQPTEKDLIEKIKYLINNREVLKKINMNIVKSNFKFDMSEHCKSIVEQYTKILN